MCVCASGVYVGLCFCVGVAFACVVFLFVDDVFRWEVCVFCVCFVCVYLLFVSVVWCVCVCV